MPVTQNGVQLTVAISEKAAEKTKDFAETDGICANGRVRGARNGVA